MDWTSLIGPAVVAAIVSGLVTTIGFMVNRSTSLTMHRQKLEADQRLVERKFELDEKLAEHKLESEIRLAERKFALDRGVVIWKQRFVLAEQLLKRAYEARDALSWSRARVVFSGEGESRKSDEHEGEELKTARNSYFVPIERLSRHADIFAALQTERYSAVTQLGEHVGKPILALLGAHQQITTAAAALIRLAQAEEDRNSMGPLQPLRAVLWGDRPDKLDAEIDSAVEQIAAICSPVLSRNSPT